VDTGKSPKPVWLLALGLRAFGAPCGGFGVARCAGVVENTVMPRLDDRSRAINSTK